MKKLVKYLFAILVVINLFVMMPISDKALAIDYTSVSKPVRVELDGHLLNFDVPPMIINDRTLVPFRVILEALGVDVGWNESTRRVTAIRDDLNIKLQIDSTEAFINNKTTKLDVSPTIIEGRTLIPARFISEALGCTVDWEENTRTVIISTPKDNTKINDKEFTFQGITIGDSADKVINTLGEPARKDLSKYGFSWYIYNGDYSKYIQVGIRDNRVVGLYTNAVNWKSKKGINIGAGKDKVQDIYGKPLDGITKGNIIYKLDNSESNVYLIDDYYATIFYDVHKENTVTSVLLIEKATEESLKDYIGEASDELRESYERQVFDLANAIRARFNKPYYKWDNQISNVARNHSKDMAQNNYFSHVNLEGESPFDRMEENNIQFLMAAENIAAGQSSAIFAHEGWMNSEGHRKNILGDCEKLGVGVYFGGDYKVYYTQNFYTQRK